jgi:hypothetical protein
VITSLVEQTLELLLAPKRLSIRLNVPCAAVLGLVPFCRDTCGHHAGVSRDAVRHTLETDSLHLVDVVDSIEDPEVTPEIVEVVEDPGALG